MAQICSLAQELPYAVGAAKKRKKEVGVGEKEKERRKEERLEFLSWLSG